MHKFLALNCEEIKANMLKTTLEIHSNNNNHKSKFSDIPNINKVILFCFNFCYRFIIYL